MLFKTVLVCLICVCAGNPAAKKLYDDLLHNYNRLIRPVYSSSLKGVFTYFGKVAVIRDPTFYFFVFLNVNYK